jgi:hypothetical protein
MRESVIGTTPAAEHIAIAHNTEFRWLRARVVISCDEELIRAKFGRAVKINGIRGFIGAEGDHFFYTAINRGVDHVFRAADIGFNRFDRVVFRSGNLLDCGGMHDIIDSRESAIEPMPVANIADKIADAGIDRLGKRLMHLELLQFVAAENDQPLRTVSFEYTLHESLTEGSCAAGNENSFIVQHLHSFAQTYNDFNNS